MVALPYLCQEMPCSFALFELCGLQATGADKVRAAHE